MGLHEDRSRKVGRMRRLLQMRSRHAVRFARAVPARSDRRELRRALRAVTRQTLHTQKRQVAAELRALAAHRTRIRAVRRGADGDEIVEFVDGTVLDLVVRDGETELRRLERRTVPAVQLRSVEPLLGHLWFRLYFGAASEESRVMAKVRRVEKGDRPPSSTE